jgi:hypothetical protein
MQKAVETHRIPITEGPRSSGTTGAAATKPRGNAKLRKVVFGAALAIVPVAVGGAVALLTRSRRGGLIAGGTCALGLGLARWQLERSFNDEPAYEVERTIGPLELRRYAARVEAETLLGDDDQTTALEHGFKILAAYIFGKNAGQEKLGMTTPVTSQYTEGDHRVAFMMPIERTAASLPAPVDPRVKLVERASRRIAVLAFRGARTDKLLEAKRAELLQQVRAAGLRARGEPVYAGFDPPWTLPFLRRNEMWIEVA